MKVNEIFEGIQGEGAYAGTPMLFIRLSGCTRACSWCDSKYHKEGTEISMTKVVKRIKKSKLLYVCWTGGEPLMQLDDIIHVIDRVGKLHHIETNGDLINLKDEGWWIYNFDYTCISPKEKKVAKNIETMRNKIKKEDFKNQDNTEVDIKVVTDLDKVGVDMLKYATMLMPLTTGNSNIDLIIKKKVWKYCLKHNLKYSPRLHVDIWGQERGK